MDINVTSDICLALELFQIVLAARNVIEMIHEFLAPAHTNASIQTIMPVEALFIGGKFLWIPTRYRETQIDNYFWSLHYLYNVRITLYE